LNVNKERRFKMNSMKKRLLIGTFALLFVICLIGLHTAVSFAKTSAAIDYLASSRSHTATMQVDDKAENVWQSVVTLDKKRNPNLKIKEENKKKLKFEASKKTESGETLWGSVKVRPLSSSSCRLIFTATMGGGKPLEKEMKAFVQDTILQYCDETGLSCKIAE
jgi:hypothetical protein